VIPPVSYYVSTEYTSPRFCAAFAAGCGGTTTSSHKLRPGPVALFGSAKLWPMLQQAQAENRELFYGDHGIFGRYRYYRIARNAYMPDGRGPSDGARFRRFNRPIQPWRTTGRTVIVCPQTAIYFGLFGLDRDAWLDMVTSALRAHTDRPIIIRDKRDRRPIETDLRDAWAVVCFSSSSALDALIAGVPVFVLANFAAAYRMGTSDLTRIESPIYPDGRSMFMGALADSQWTLDEIRRGVAWEALRVH
jgi:hypothetical protein